MNTIAIILLILLNILALYGTAVEPFWIEVDHRTIPVSAEHAFMKNVRCVHISDVHMDRYGWFEKRIVRIVNEQKPDMVFVTGDSIHYRRDYGEALRFFSDLKAPEGVYVVMGNAEYHAFNLVLDALHTNTYSDTVHILQNEMRTLSLPQGGTIRITGLADPITGAADFSLLTKPCDPATYSIVLMHAFVEEAWSPKVTADLICSGHTHGGQVDILPGFIMKRWLDGEYHLTIPYLRGLHQRGKTWINVSRGLGVSALPIRVNSRPEVSVLSFEEKKIEN